MHDFMIAEVEKALGFKLYDNQINFLSGAGGLGFERKTGRTTALCIRLALSVGAPLDMRKPEVFSDMEHLPILQHLNYSRNSFRHEFLTIRQKLKDYGFIVRDITGLHSQEKRTP